MSGSSYGVYGVNVGSGNYGYVGGNTTGLYGQHTSSGNYGYLGSSAYGVRGQNTNSGNYGYLGGSGAAVYGESATGYGVYAYSGNSPGVYGSSNSGTGVYGISSTGYAGHFQGNVYVSGTLSKGGGSFKIDHPLDPGNKYLQHSFVESPDMMNVYSTIDTCFHSSLLPLFFAPFDIAVMVENRKPYVCIVESPLG